MASNSHKPYPAEKLLPVALTVGLLVALGGCGGGHNASVSSGSSPTSPAAKSKPKPEIAEAVRLDLAGARFQPSLRAQAGQKVEFRTVVPISKRQQGSTLVRLNIVRGPATRLSVNASKGHQTATATIVSADQKPLALNGVHYQCALPPATTFCPVQHLITTSKGYRMQVSVGPKTPIVIVAKLAPTAAPPRQSLRPSTSGKAPPYVATAKVRVITPVSGGQPKKSPPTSAATVHAGQVVAMETLLGGKVSGAPQTATVTFPGGSGKSIVITAHVSGGPPSHATVTGAAGSRIALDLPHFTCFLPPYPTFCPARSAQLAHGQYTLTFNGTPNTSPILVVARVRQL